MTLYHSTLARSNPIRPYGAQIYARFTPKNGRAGGIRTHDLLNPIQAHYQAVLRPDVEEAQDATSMRYFQAGIMKALSQEPGVRIQEFRKRWALRIQLGMKPQSLRILIEAAASCWIRSRNSAELSCKSSKSFPVAKTKRGIIRQRKSSMRLLARLMTDM